MKSMLAPVTRLWIGPLLATLSLTGSMAHANQACLDVFAEPLAVPAMKSIAANYESPNAKASQALKAVRGLRKEWRGQNLLVMKNLEKIIANEELVLTHMRIEKIMRVTIELDARQDKPSGESILATLQLAVEAELKKTMPEAEAKRRSALLSEAGLDSRKTEIAFGRMSAKETLESLIGPNGIREISPDSLVGRYLSEAQAIGVNPSTLISSFGKGSDKPGQFGDERLFIAVDKRTADIAQRLFGQAPELLAHNHEPNQNTLHLRHLGRDVSYAQYGSERMFAWSYEGTETGTIIPLIALSTVESSRTYDYFELGRLTNQARAKYPWSLGNDRRSPEQYCRMGGYTSCTHWFGEMPIGEGLTTQYSFPGQPDNHAYQSSPTATNQRELRTATIGTYSGFIQHNQINPIGTETRTDRLTRIVWKQGKGNQQLWEMMNLKGELERGELANPGWVMYSLIGAASADRVPVVLLYRGNAGQPLTEKTMNALKRKISAY